MRLLLDSHVFLWWLADDPRLGSTARDAIMDAGNEVYVSAVVAWEIAIKRALGRLEFEGHVGQAIVDEGFEPLSVHVDHADEVAALPLIHADPFDRMLIAQARVERLTLVTRDGPVADYGGFGMLRA